ncbi:unnamed protein product [Caretta caretta]
MGGPGEQDRLTVVVHRTTRIEWGWVYKCSFPTEQGETLWELKRLPLRINELTTYEFEWRYEGSRANHEGVYHLIQEMVTAKTKIGIGCWNVRTIWNKVK